MSFSFRSRFVVAFCFGCFLYRLPNPSQAEPAHDSSAIDLVQIFENPPEAAHPWVFWYWMNGCVSAEGITADLEAMKRVGITGAYLMPIRGPSERSACDHPVAQLSPEWWGLVRHAMQEAQRLKLKFAMHACDGFAVAGGPWITPELSMQKVVWSATRVHSDDKQEIILPQPETNEGFYRDVVVWAFPSLPGESEEQRTAPTEITTSIADFDAGFLSATGHGKRVRMEEPGWIDYQYAVPFTCRSITIIPDGNNYQAQRLLLQVSDNGKSYRKVCRLKPPRQGWQNGGGVVTYSIPTVTAKHFRFAFDKEGSEPGAEDLDSAKWSPVLKLQSIVLSGAPRIHQYRGKNGAVWRISERTTEDQIPEALCIDPKSMINLTDQMRAEGHLDWRPPGGDWTILRMGHTSTGMRNETGGAGKGLECDKLNSDAVRLQFDRWFGEIYRQMGSELADEVLKVFHVDSWECGSQNWTHDFATEFHQRHGYDPVQYLPAMAGYPVKSAACSEDFLHDVRETISDLLVERFFRTFRELAHARGCQFSAECVAPTMLSDGMRPFAEVDVPMGEFWLHSPTHDKPNDVRDAVSAAHVYGKPIVQAEAFTELRMNWREAPGELKALGDLHFCLGINRFVFHVFTHNPYLDRKPGMTLDNIGLFFQRDQTWWEPAHAWIGYISRCQALLQVGEPVVDLAIHTGSELPRRSMLPEKLTSLVPGLLGDTVLERERQRLENAGAPTEESPPGVQHSANISAPEDWCDPLRGYAYDSINTDALTRANWQDGKLQLPSGMSYSVLVAAEAAVADNTPHVEKVESADLSKHGITRDFQAFGSSGVPVSDIAWTHRRLDDTDLYFVSNQSGESRQVTVNFRVVGKVPEVWDPVTLDRQDAAVWSAIGEHTQVELHLPPSGSLFVIFRRDTDEAGSGPYVTTPTYDTIETLSGPWKVGFDPKVGGPPDAQHFRKLTAWTTHANKAVRYYSGTAQYSLTFSWSGSRSGQANRWLDLGQVHDVAKVSLNGKACGIAWTPPYRVKIDHALRVGDNELTIDVTNTWHNRLLGDALETDKSWTWTTANSPPKDSPLAPAGLLGPVTILSKQLNSK